MILFSELLFENREQIDKFAEVIREETFDEYSQNGVEIIIRYLYDCFDAGEKLTEMVHKQIALDIIPIVCLEFEKDTISNNIEFAIMSENDRELSFREEILFNQLCDTCFHGIKGLYDRFCYES